MGGAVGEVKRGLGVWIHVSEVAICRNVIFSWGGGEGYIKSEKFDILKYRAIDSYLRNVELSIH